MFDLFAALDATDEQLDFPILYGSAKLGYMATSLEGSKEDGMTPLFDLVLKHVKAPAVDTGPFRLLGTIIEANPYLGRMITGRITSGSVKPNQMVKVLDREGKLIESGRITKVLAFRGLERVPLDEAEAGDIVALAGLPNATVAHTICDPSVETPIPAQPIDPPTLSMTFRVNDSPLAGTEGTKVTGRMIRDRLLREAEGNVALRVRESDDKDAMEVSGRGELQLGILIETMRREGFELSVSRPKVLLRKNDTGRTRRADRGSRHRRRRTAFRRRRAEDVGAQRRDDRTAPVRRRTRAHGVLRADARPDRLPGRTAHRHARHRHHEPAVPRL